MGQVSYTTLALLLAVSFAGPGGYAPRPAGI